MGAGLGVILIADMTSGLLGLVLSTVVITLFGEILPMARDPSLQREELVCRSYLISYDITPIFLAVRCHVLQASQTELHPILRE